MEAATVPARPPAASILDRVRGVVGRVGLPLLLLALPIAFGINDLITEGNLSRLGNNLVDGLSNGAGGLP